MSFPVSFLWEVWEVMVLVINWLYDIDGAVTAHLLPMGFPLFSRFFAGKNNHRTLGLPLAAGRCRCKLGRVCGMGWGKLLTGFVFVNFAWKFCGVCVFGWLLPGEVGRCFGTLTTGCTHKYLCIICVCYLHVGSYFFFCLPRRKSSKKKRAQFGQWLRRPN